MTGGVQIWRSYCLWFVENNAVPDDCYDLGVKGQGKLFFKICLAAVFHFLTKGVHLKHNDCLWWCVHYNEVVGDRYYFGV